MTKILDSAEFKAFADDKINTTQTFKFIFVTVENIVGKKKKKNGENAGYYHFSQCFLLFSVCFQKDSSFLDPGIVW